MTDTTSACVFWSLPCEAWTAGTAIATWVLAIATWVLAFATRNLIRQAQKDAQAQIAAMRETTRAQLEAAEQATQQITKEETSRLAAALQSEITVLHNRFEAVFGEAIEEWKENEEPRFGGVVHATNLFVVFDQNASKLGLFKKEDTHIVIRAYTLMKTLVESVNAVSEVRQENNNQMVAYRASNNLDALNSVREILRSYTNRMVPVLKKEWQDVVYTTNDAKRVLEKYAS